MGTLIITRHSAYVEHLKEIGLVDDQVKVITHVENPSQLEGKDVITSGLPYHLAAQCSTVTTVPLWVPENLRGEELTVKQVRQYAKPAKTYKVIPDGIITLYEVVCYASDGPGYDTRHSVMKTLSHEEAQECLERENGESGGGLFRFDIETFCL